MLWISDWLRHRFNGDLLWDPTDPETSDHAGLRILALEKAMKCIEEEIIGLELKTNREQIEDSNSGTRSTMGIWFQIADKLAEASLVFSYSKVGYKLRNKMWDHNPQLDSMGDRVVVITGASSGIGRAAAIEFLRMGATVVLAVRNRAAGEAARDEMIQLTQNDRVVLERVDVSSLGSVEAFCDRLTESFPAIDVLLHNAGTMAHDYSETREGNEVTWATHVLGPFLMTKRLEPLLLEAEQGRVVFVSSGGMYAARLNVEDPQWRGAGYSGIKQYARTKRAQLVLTTLLARQLETTRVTVNAMHPGWAATKAVAEKLPRFNQIMGPILRSPEEGADTLVWLGSSPDVTRETGMLWFDRAPRKHYVVPGTRHTSEEERALWTQCCDATDVDSPLPF